MLTRAIKNLASVRGYTLHIALVVVATATLIFSPLSTQKAAAAMTCSTPNVCMWADSFGGGGSIAFYSPSRFTCINLPSNWYDRISSLYNHMNNWVYFYSQTNCGGWNYDLAPLQIKSDLSGTGMNDEIRSVWIN